MPLVAGRTGLPCDRHLDLGTPAREFGAFARAAGLAAALWAEGISALPGATLGPLAEAFLVWCRRLGPPRVHLASHDGTTSPGARSRGTGFRAMPAWRSNGAGARPTAGRAWPHGSPRLPGRVAMG